MEGTSGDPEAIFPGTLHFQQLVFQVGVVLYLVLELSLYLELGSILRKGQQDYPEKGPGKGAAYL